MCPEYQQLLTSGKGRLGFINDVTSGRSATCQGRPYSVISQATQIGCHGKRKQKEKDISKMGWKE